MKILYLVILFLIPVIVLSQKSPEAKVITQKDYQEFIKKNPSNTDHNETNDVIIGNLYRNKKYKFRIQLIPSWELIKGDGLRIILGDVQRDSAKTISIGVADYEKKLTPLKKLSDEEINLYKKSMIENFKLQNRIISNIEVINGYLSNFPALIVTSNQIEKSQEQEVAYYNKSISCVANGILYTVSLSMPLSFYGISEKERFDEFVANFKFEFGMY